MLLRWDLQDCRPEAKPIIGSEVVMDFTADVKLVGTILKQILAIAQPPQFPYQLRNSLLRNFQDDTQRQAAYEAAKRLNPDKAQTWVDFVDLVRPCR